MFPRIRILKDCKDCNDVVMITVPDYIDYWIRKYLLFDYRWYFLCYQCAEEE